MVNRTADDADAISISASFISEPAQKFRALGRQGERYRNHCYEISVIRALARLYMKAPEHCRIPKRGREFDIRFSLVFWTAALLGRFC